MAGVAPLLDFVWHVKFGLEQGLSARQTLISYAGDEALRAEIVQFISLQSQQRPLNSFYGDLKSSVRRCLFQVLERGLKGEAIYTHISELEVEISQVCIDEIEKSLSTLPYKMLVPLFLFQLPSFLLLLFGPLLKNLFAALEGL